MSTDSPSTDDQDTHASDQGTHTDAQDPWLSAEQQRMWRSWITLHAQATTALSRQLARDSQLSMPDYEILVHLSEAPDHRWRMAELADRLQWDRSRMSHQIRRMEDRGLLRRESCTEDKRGAYAAIEPAGLSAIEQAAPGHARLVKELFFAHLTPEQQRDFATVLDRLDKVIGAAS